MAFPENEEETIALFKLIQHQLGWRIAHLQTRFPDAVIENENGQQLVAEFEYKSKNFRMHGHSPTGCDLIICYQNNWEEAPMPVWALKGCADEVVTIVRKINGTSISLQQYFDVCGENARLQDEIHALKAQLKQSQFINDAPKEISIQSEPIPERIELNWIDIFGSFCFGFTFRYMVLVLLDALKFLN